MTVPKAPRSGYLAKDAPSIPDWIYELPIIGGVISTGAEIGGSITTGLAGAASGYDEETKQVIEEEFVERGLLGKRRKKELEARRAQQAQTESMGNAAAQLSEAVDRLASGPLYLGESFRIHAERNADGVERLFFQLKTTDKWESFLSLDDSGAMKLKGALTQDTTFDTEGEEPQ